LSKSPIAAEAVRRIDELFEIERTINGKMPADRGHIGPDAPGDDAELITTCVHRIEVRQTEIAISMLSEDPLSDDTTPSLVTVPWSKPAQRRHRDVIVPEGASPTEGRAIRADARVKLITAIARARQWLSEIEAGTATIDAVAKREACSKRHVSMTISLAFLAPNLVKAAVDGRLPRGVGVARLFDAPVAWSRQQQMLGFVH
jgi:hypothetical protein